MNSVSPLNTSRKANSDTYGRQAHLTRSEIDSLRQDFKAAMKQAKTYIQKNSPKKD